MPEAVIFQRKLAASGEFKPMILGHVFKTSARYLNGCIVLQGQFEKGKEHVHVFTEFYTQHYRDRREFIVTVYSHHMTITSLHLTITWESHNNQTSPSTSTPTVMMASSNTPMLESAALAWNMSSRASITDGAMVSTSSRLSLRTKLWSVAQINDSRSATCCLFPPVTCPC